MDRTRLILAFIVLAAFIGFLFSVFNNPLAVPVWQFVAFIGIILLSVGTIASLINAKELRWLSVFIVVLQTMVSILACASIYRAEGLYSGGEVVFPDAWTAIYFSIVTWTTLGYGDYAPTPDVRLFASLEAMMGYVMLGVLVGEIAGHLGRKDGS